MNVHTVYTFKQCWGKKNMKNVFSCEDFLIFTHLFQHKLNIFWTKDQTEQREVSEDAACRNFFLNIPTWA